MSYVRKEVLADGVTLYLGDMLEVLPALGAFDACVTDPPYGINAHNGICRSDRRKFGSGDVSGEWDKAPPPLETFDLLLKCSMYQIIWGGELF